MKTSTFCALTVGALALSMGVNAYQTQMLVKAGQTINSERVALADKVDKCAQGNNVYITSCEIQAVVVKGPKVVTVQAALEPPPAWMKDLGEGR